VASDKRPVEINMSGIPVAGVGGLGLVAMAAVVSVFFPAIGWMMAVALAGGIALGVALVVARRVSKGSGPTGDDPKILFRDRPAEAGSLSVAHRDRRAADREFLIVNS
jgi:sugar phosphate permease